MAEVNLEVSDNEIHVTPLFLEKRWFLNKRKLNQIIQGKIADREHILKAVSEVGKILTFIFCVICRIEFMVLSDFSYIRSAWYRLGMLTYVHMSDIIKSHTLAVLEIPAILSAAANSKCLGPIQFAKIYLQ